MKESNELHPICSLGHNEALPQHHHLQQQNIPSEIFLFKKEAFNPFVMVTKLLLN